MANIDNIKEVKIGSATVFRNTISDNFDTVKEEWSGIYTGYEDEEANEKLAVGGLWIVTESPGVKRTWDNTGAFEDYTDFESLFYE